MSNITSVVFDQANEIKTIYNGLWQYDYGQILRIEGLDLPAAVEIHFSLQETGGEAKRRIGKTSSGVTDVVIPDFILEGNDATRDYNAYAFIYLSDEESGETTHKIKMQIKARSKPEGSTGSDETSFGAIMDALKTFAAGKADGLKYENSILKLMSGEAELARVTIKAGEGTGSDAREIELQKSDTAIQWRYVGDEEWTDLVLLEELKGEKGDPGEGGKTAYQYAQDGGYTGTEEEFAKKLAQENPTREEFSRLSDTIADKATVENGVVKVWKSAAEDGGTDTLLYTIDLSGIGGTSGLDLNNLTLSVSQVGEYQRLSMSDGTTTKTVDIPITVISDEQVQTAVETWLNDHPETMTTIQDGSIAKEKLSSELQDFLDNLTMNGISLYKTRIEQFLTEYHDDIYEINLDSNVFADQKSNYYYTVKEDTPKQYRTTGNYISLGENVLYLKKGARIITNADTVLERVVGATSYGKGVLFTNITDNNATPDLYFGYGRGAFDGIWQVFEVPESEFYIFSYFNSTEYETKLYVYQPSALTVPKNFERIYPMIYDGYMKTTPCEYSLVNSKTYYQTVNGGTGTYQNKVTEPIVLSGYKGYSLLVYSPFGDLANTESTSGMGAIVYNSDDTEVKNLIVQCDFYSKDYYTIPLSDEELHVRIGFSAEASSPLLQFAIVPNEWLFANHLVPSKALYGKKILAFGDSYVNGHTMNYYHVWYALLARKNYGYYYQCGHNGAGLCRSSAVASLLTLISELDTEADIYFMVCGRNDSSMNVPIGEPSDTFNPETDMENSSTTNTTASFMGGLNYMYNYVIEKHPNAKFIAVTPWSFTPLASVTSGLDSYDYIEAIKRISQKWGILCYNASQDSGIHVQSEAFRTLYFLSSTDQSHLNEDGHKVMYENSLPWIEAHL